MQDVLPVVLGAAVILLQIALLVVLPAVLRGRTAGSGQGNLRDEGDRIRRFVSQSGEDVKRALAAGLSDQRRELSEGLAVQRDEMRRAFAEIREEQTKNAEAVRATVERKLEEIRTANEQKLEQMRATVDEKLQKTLDERLGESFKTVERNLKAVYESIGEMQNLAKDVGGLKKALTNVKARGIFGEIQLERLLEEVFPPEQYEKNFDVRGTGERVEFALKLPGKGDRPVYLPIDSKYPSEDYERLTAAYEAGDLAAAEAARKSIASFIKGQAEIVRRKYVEPPLTTDFALIFLPFEGLYAEVLRIPGLAETLQSRYKINLCGPTTLLALLNSLMMGFKTLAIEKRSDEVRTLLSAVRTEFEKFSAQLQKTRSKIQEAEQELITLVGTRTNMMMRQLRKVEKLPEDRAEALLISDGYDGE